MESVGVTREFVSGVEERRSGEGREGYGCVVLWEWRKACGIDGRGAGSGCALVEKLTGGLLLSGVIYSLPDALDTSRVLVVCNVVIVHSRVSSLFFSGLRAPDRYQVS